MNEQIGKCVIFSAPSGSGKTTVVQYLLKKMPVLEFSVSACNRTPRPNEQHGKDYYFLTTKEFQQKIENKEFIEWEEVYPERYYGTLVLELERIWEKNKIVVFDVDVVGGIRLKEKLAERALSIFIAPPSIQILKQRLQMRGTETQESLSKRIEKATWELQFANKFDKQLLNDNLEQTCEKTLQIINEFIKK